MSQVVLDEQLSVETVLAPLQRWTTARMIQDLRPRQRITDDRIPNLIRALRGTTFVTIDETGFWKRSLCDARYCVVCFALRRDQQQEIPPLLRRLFLMPEFRTRAKRLGKVVRVSRATIRFYQLTDRKLHVLTWPVGSSKTP